MLNRTAQSYNTWIAVIFLVIGAVSLATHDLPTGGAFVSAGAALLIIGNNAAAWKTYPAWRRGAAISLLACAALCVIAQFATTWAK